MTSKIKVDNITDQDDNNIINESGDVITVGAAGDTVAVAGNIVKSNALQASDAGNIISQSGTTITIGASGDTVSLACGASQSGFGRSGTVDWQTGSIKTSTFTAVSGQGFFADTSGGAITMNLPAGTAGAIVSVVDYTNTFQTNNLTISPNGSQKIGGIAANFIASTEGQSLTFVYVDDTEGWKNVQDSTSNATGNPFLIATGGTETTSGDCKIHTFTGPGTFTVSSASQTAAENIVSYLVVAGGGGGGRHQGGGGGAGGFRELKSPTTPYTASPLDGYPSSPNRVTVTAQAYPITVGSGGASGTGNCSGTGATGGVSTFSTITSAGGGGGGGYSNVPNGIAGGNGGSGGGGSSSSQPGGGLSNGGTGNTPPTTPAQGSNGGGGFTPSPHSGGGGGGATGVGGSITAPGCNGGAGGAGAITHITGSPVAYAGGGGGSACGGPAGGGTNAGGGAGGKGTSPGTAGTANTGGGGGGGASNSAEGAAGGSGIVVIRYKFQ